MQAIKKAVNEVNVNQSLAMFNTVAFLSYALDEYNFSYDKRLIDNEVRALKYSSALLGIAGLHYSVLDTSDLSSMSDILIRYPDWILTTPLLLKVLAEYYKLDDKITTNLIIYNVMMVGFGLMYELTGNYLFWGFGTIFYLMIAYTLNKELPEKDLFYKYFLFGWSAYGVVSLLPKNKRILPYNILDCYNKLIFAMEIRHKITKDMEKRNYVMDGYT